MFNFYENTHTIIKTEMSYQILNHIHRCLNQYGRLENDRKLRSNDYACGLF